MMKRFGWIIGAIIIVIVLVAAEMTIISYASGDNTKQKVVCARVRIKKNTVITPNMLEIKEISSDAVHPSALGNIDEAVTMCAVMDIEEGEMLLKAKLKPDKPDVVSAEDTSKRLICAEFRIDQANAWQFSENQYVDIIFIPNDTDEQDRVPYTEGVTNVSPASSGIKVMKGIRIAGVMDENAKKIDVLETESIPRYVSFEVTQEQATFLAYAKNSGKLELSFIPTISE